MASAPPFSTMMFYMMLTMSYPGPVPTGSHIIDHIVDLYMQIWYDDSDTSDSDSDDS